MLDDDDERAPLTGSARREYQLVMRCAAIWDMKGRADEVAAMYRSLEPTPTLDELPQLDADPHKRERQLMLLWLVERRFRFRLQDNLRRSLQMLAG